MNDVLPSWNEGKAKDSIVTYVQRAINPDSEGFIPEQDRIVTLDNDGCCWIEKPTYIQLYFAIARLKQLATENSSLRQQPHYQAAYDDDMSYFSRLDPHTGGDLNTLLQVVFDSHAGISQDEFQTISREFLLTAKHPRYDKPFSQMVYQPMLELIHYLHANDFKVFMCSAGGMSFMRSICEDVYGIPKQRVIGSNVSLQTVMTADGPLVMRQSSLIEPLDDGAGKPINIELHVGRKPVIAGGNSDGDLHMLWYAETSQFPSLSLLIQHDDADREYQYDRGAENVLKTASERGWTVVSMKHDWKRVFSWE